MAGECRINAARLPIHIPVFRDRDDAGVMGKPSVQPAEVFAIACESHSTETRREGKLIGIANALVCSTRLMSREDVVAE